MIYIFISGTGDEVKSAIADLTEWALVLVRRDSLAVASVSWLCSLMGQQRLLPAHAGTEDWGSRLS